MKNEGSKTDKLTEWLKTVDVDTLPDCEVELFEAFRLERHFRVSGNADDAIKKFAELAEMEIIEVALESEDDLRGERVMHFPNTPEYNNETTRLSARRNKSRVAYDLDEGCMPYFDYELWWREAISRQAEKKYLLLFNVDKADKKTLDLLKTEIEMLDGRSYRPVVGIVCHDAARDIQSKADGFVRYRITWEK